MNTQMEKRSLYDERITELEILASNYSLTERMSDGYFVSLCKSSRYYYGSVINDIRSVIYPTTIINKPFMIKEQYKVKYFKNISALEDYLIDNYLHVFNKEDIRRYKLRKI